MTVGRRNLVAGIAILASLAGGTAWAVAPVASAAPSSAACRPLKPHAQVRIDAAGKPLRPGSPNAANAALKKTYEYGGLEFSTVIPPSSFTPATADVSTLKAYGYSHLPKDPAALKTWRTMHGRKFRSAESVPCVSNTYRDPLSPSPTATPSDSPSTGGYRTTNGNGTWGGFIDTGRNDFVSAEAFVTEASYNTSCGDNANTDASPWVGLGGLGYYDPFLQNGYDSGVWTDSTHTETTTNGARLWWEAMNIGGNDYNPQIYIGSDHAAPGAVMDIETNYQPNGVAVFTWQDLTTGISWTPVSLADGSHFYSGESADFIDEFPSNQFAAFRSFGQQQWSGYASTRNAQGATTSGGVFQYSWVQELLQNSAKQTMLSDHIDTNSPTDYIQTWQRCN